MKKADLQALEAVAENYEGLLAPALFAEWAPRMADALEIQPGQDALDVACGTGLLARAMAEQVGSRGSVSGIDANPGMLAVARRIAPDVDWRQGDAHALPYQAECFDVVACQFGLMLFSEPEQALREMRRVLKPGGHLGATVFGPLEELPVYAMIADVYARVVAPSVGNALRMPFSMGDRNALAALFSRADIPAVDIQTLDGTARFGGVRNMVLADVKGWFPFAGIHLDDDAIEAVVEAAESELAPFLDPVGRVTFPIPVHLATAM